MRSQGSTGYKSDITGVQSARLRSLICYWTGKRGDRAMPARCDLDPLEIPSLLPITLLADVADSRARVRLLGTEATAAYGAECRGRTLEEIDLGEFTAVSSKLLDMVLASNEPAAAAGSFINRTELSRVEMVLTPLSADGYTVSHIFGGLIIRPILRTSLMVRPMPVTYISHLKDGSAGIPRTVRTSSCYSRAE